MSEENKAAAPRIAIKFGAPSNNNNNNNNNSKKLSKPKPPSSLGKRPRSHALGGGSDSEPDDDEHRGRHEKITGFGADGAETERKPKDPRTEKKDYVIARQPNRDWRSEMKTQKKSKNLLPEEARAQQSGATVETEQADQDKGLKWGLTIKEKTVGDDQHEDDNSNPAEDTSPSDESGREPPPKRTADDEAMDALLGNKTEDEKIIHTSEEDAYRRDIQGAGEASTLEDYEAMPVEEFGAALLRGMGWDGKPRGTVKEVKRRPNRLGLGAKELKEAEDLGGWNQGSKKNRRPRLDEYRREESKRKESRRQEDSYKRIEIMTGIETGRATTTETGDGRPIKVALPMLYPSSSLSTESCAWLRINLHRPMLLSRHTRSVFVDVIYLMARETGYMYYVNRNQRQSNAALLPASLRCVNSTGQLARQPGQAARCIPAHLHVCRLPC